MGKEGKGLVPCERLGTISCTQENSTFHGLDRAKCSETKKLRLWRGGAPNSPQLETRKAGLKGHRSADEDGRGRSSLK